jgi:hypothetical protein
MRGEQAQETLFTGFSSGKKKRERENEEKEISKTNQPYS